MKLHERTMHVQKAQNELSALFLDWLKKQDLTWNEAAVCLHQIEGRCLMYMLRDERHPDEPDKKADEE